VGTVNVLIDRFLPHYDFHEHHAMRVRAAPERIYDVIRHDELTAHPIVRVLLALRGLARARRTFSLDGALQQGFVLLADEPPREIVLGIEGPFWQPSCKLRVPDFTRPVPGGMARGVWNFRIEGDLVSTETRVLCADDARAKFRAYWLFVRPFSGLIRRLMLREIRRRCTA
jgi:hypothetical protein